MASKHQVTLTFAGDATSLEKTFDQVSDGATDMASNVDKAAGKMDTLAERADNGERRLLGLKDTVDGVATIMQGPGEAGIAAYIQGLADTASGVANFVIPALKSLTVQSIRAAAAHVASAGRQVVAWTVLGAQSLANAAKVAAAWLVSMGPIILVGAAVAGLVALIIANWDRIKEVITKAARAIMDWLSENWVRVKEIFTAPVEAATRFVRDKWDSVVAFISGLPSRIRSAARGLFDGVREAFRSAINWIIDHWNSFRFTIGPVRTVFGQVGPWHLDTPDIPRLHTGGIFRSPTPGGEGLALLRDGERVLPPGQSTPVVRLEVTGDGSRFADALVEVLARAIRIRGGDVQLVLGGRRRG